MCTQPSISQEGRFTKHKFMKRSGVNGNKEVRLNYKCLQPEINSFKLLIFLTFSGGKLKEEKSNQKIKMNYQLSDITYFLFVESF